MRYFILFCTASLFASGYSFAESCFTHHLTEALSLNRTRSLQYARLTYGRSLFLSAELMSTEVTGLIPAQILEFQASRFQKAGIPILCDDFVSMELTPKFSATSGTTLPNRTEFVEIEVARWNKELRKAWETDGYPGLQSATLQKIELLSKQKKVNCLVRHVLESLARIAFLAPKYSEAAVKKGLANSPLSISNELVEIHLRSLWVFHKLDGQALSFQLEGIPILCQDVPHIDVSGS